MEDITEYIPRIQTSKIRSALASLRIVVLTGARQTGKTTLAKMIGREDDRVFLTLDRPETLELAVQDPEALWEGLKRVTIDEVQRSPRLLNFLKLEVDQNPVPGRFLLTGSANLLLMAKISDSLAGRASYIGLPPITLAERMKQPGGTLLHHLLEVSETAEIFENHRMYQSGPPLSLAQAIFEGGYPEAIQLADNDARNLWREGYITTYLERDLRNLSQIADLPDFIRLFRLAALRSGQVVNVDGLARDAGLSSSTARRYLNLLTVSYQLFTIPAYATSKSKRLIKSPKLFVTDSGIACHMCGITNPSEIDRSPQLGGLFETYIFQHLLAFTDLIPGSPTKVLYWRTTRGEEVDCVVETHDRLLPIEIKTSRAIRKRDLRGLTAFLNEYPDQAPFGIILYSGKEWLRPARKIIAIPWSTFTAN